MRFKPGNTQIAVALTLLIGGLVSSSVPVNAAPSCIASGSLAVSTSHPVPEIRELERLFAAECPDVDLIWTRADDIRLLSDMRHEDGQDRQADLMILSDVSLMARLVADGRVVPLTPPSDVRLLDGTAGPRDLYVGIALSPLAIVARSDTVPPARWRDLGRIFSAERIAIADPRQSASMRAGLVVLSRRVPETGGVLQSIATSATGFRRGHRDALIAVLNGDADIAVTLSPLVSQAGLDRAGLDVHHPEDGAPVRMRVAAILESVSNRPAADAFIRLLLSDAAQGAMIARGYHTVRADIAESRSGMVGVETPVLRAELSEMLDWLNADISWLRQNPS